MPNAPIITEAELIEKIKKSPLGERQKSDLIGLAHAMTESERNEVLALIQEAQKAAEEDPEYQKKLKELAGQYEQKLNAMAHTEALTMRKEMENFDRKEGAGEMDAVEKEAIQIAALAAQKEPAVKKPKNKHLFFKFTLVLLFLLAIIAGALYILQNLN